MIKTLDGSSVGIAVVTPSSSERPWINFEAGAIARAIEPSGGIVAPLLINMRESNLNGPMKTLQVTQFEKDDFFPLLQAINVRVRSSLTENELRDEFELKWPRLVSDVEVAIKNAEAIDPATNSKPPARPQEEVPVVAVLPMFPVLAVFAVVLMGLF